MRILGLDFETTGIDTATDRVIEIGAVLWDTERKAPLQMISHLIKHDPSEGVVLSPEIQELTHIRPEDLEICGIPAIDGFEQLLAVFAHADFIVAHNGTGFDKPIFEAEVKRLGLSEWSSHFNRHWIDTRTDVNYPKEMTARNMKYLSEAHQVTSSFAHRALFDVLTMLQILSCYDINEVIALSKVPNVVVKALVSFENKDKAKARGYWWHKETKTWRKSLKATHLESERAEAGFGLDIIN